MKKLLLASLLTVWAWCPAFADGTINTLGVAAAVQATDVFPAFQGANPATGVTGAQIKTWAAGVTSIGTGCGVTGGTITTTGTISGGVTVSLQTGVNYAFQGTDCGKLINLSNASAQVPTIAPAGTGSFISGWFVQACNQAAGSQTITPTPATSTIGGAASYVLPGGSAIAPACITIVSDGTNYQVVPSATISASSNLTWTGVQTYNETIGAVSTQSGTTYTFAATDCGTTVRFSNASAVTATIPQGLPIGCNIAVLQAGAGQVAVNGSAVTPATLQSAHSYTKTFGAGAAIGIMTDVSNHAILTGDGA